MGFRIHVLGAGSILPRVGFGCAGYALCVEGTSDITLLDCGPGSIRNLAASGLRVEDVKRVVFSHYHLDHCLDFFALIFARRNPAATFAPLEAFGPVGLRKLVEETPKGLGPYAVDPTLTWREIEVDAEGCAGFESGGLSFVGIANGHNREALSWRVDGSGAGGPWSLAYSGDTGENPRVADIAHDADVFVCECSFDEAHAQPNHLTPLQAGRLAAMAGARKLVLTHFYPGLDPKDAMEKAAEAFDGPIESAADGSSHVRG